MTGPEQPTEAEWNERALAISRRFLAEFSPKVRWPEAERDERSEDET